MAGKGETKGAVAGRGAGGKGDAGTPSKPKISAAQKRKARAATYAARRSVLEQMQDEEEPRDPTAGSSSGTR